MGSQVVKCKKCKNAFPYSFRFCPLDGMEFNALPASDTIEPGTEASHLNGAAMISVRKLMLGLAILLLVPIVALTADFMYHHLRPRYGSLVVKTVPEGATIFVDGQVRGTTPLTVAEVPSGRHRVRVVKSGYKGLIHNVDVFQYATHSVRITLEPLTPALPNKHLAQLESWRLKMAGAFKKRVLVSPPADSNALYYANKILEIDPNNVAALAIRQKIGQALRTAAESAYTRQDWLRAEKHYMNLVLALPNDTAIGQRLAEIRETNRTRFLEREHLLADWTARAEAAIKAGSLLPPEKENAMDALRNIHQLDVNNSYAREAIQRVKELLQVRAEAKMTNRDWEGARTDFKIVLQYFPEDNLSQSRLQMLEGHTSVAAPSESERALNFPITR